MSLPRVTAIATLALLSLAPGLVSAQSGGTWRRLDSPNFVIIGDENPGRLRQLEARIAAVPSTDVRDGIERPRRLAPGRYDDAFVQAQVLAKRGEFEAAATPSAPS